MKKIIIKVFIILLLILNTGANIRAQDGLRRIDDNAIRNLIAGIESDNLGLKRSAIYFAGKYRLGDLVDLLIDEMKNSNDGNIKILTALSLNQIGERRGIEAIGDQINEEKNIRVKKMFIAIYKEAVT